MLCRCVCVKESIYYERESVGEKRLSKIFLKCQPKKKKKTRSCSLTCLTSSSIVENNESICVSDTRFELVFISANICADFSMLSSVKFGNALSWSVGRALLLFWVFLVPSFAPKVFFLNQLFLLSFVFFALFDVFVSRCTSRRKETWVHQQFLKYSKKGVFG